MARDDDSREQGSAPRPLRPPALVGPARIGSAVTVDPGRWDGAPALGFEWLCDGRPVPGARHVRYVPGPDDDRKALACRVTAANAAGSAVAVTVALPVRHPPPVARGGLAEEVFDLGSGQQVVEAAAGFEGAALRYQVRGGGATIDAATGRVGIPTDRPLAEPVTVTARNSGGAASTGFMVTVEAPEIRVAAAEAPAAAPAWLGWRMFNVRTPQELAVLGSGPEAPVGDQEQHFQGATRSVSDPRRLYLAQDIGCIRRSDDGGRSWRICQGRGLLTAFFTGIECDPVNPDVVMVMTNMRANPYARAQTGIWRSEDGGVSWSRAHALGNCGEPRTIQNTLAWAPSSTGATEALRWYAANPDMEERSGSRVWEADDQFLRSDDGGRSWRRMTALPKAIFGNTVFVVKVDPLDPDLVWLGTATGLFRSTSAGAGFERVATVPEGAVTWLEIAPADGDDIFVSVRDRGAYRSRDGFATAPAPLVEMETLRRARPNPADWNVVYLISRDGTQLRVAEEALSGRPRVSEITAEPVPGHRGSWNSFIEAVHADVLPDPTDTRAAWAFSNGHFFRTADRLNWVPSRHGFTGNAISGGLAQDQLFDPTNPDRFILPLIDKGIVFTTDRGASFTGRGFPQPIKQELPDGHSSIAAAAVSPAGDGRMIAAGGRGSRSRICFSPDWGETWTLPAMANATGKNWYLGYSRQEPDLCYGGVHRSTDGGASWAEMTGLTSRVRDAAVIGVSRSNGSVVWAMQLGGRGSHRVVWRSTDRGETWAKAVEVSGDWSFQTPVDNIPVFCTDPVEETAFWTLSGGRGGVAGSVARFDIAAGRWTHCDVWQVLPRSPDNTVRSIVVDPRDPDRVYVTLAQWGQPKVLGSTDRGAGWQDLTLGCHQMAGDALVVSPFTGELIWGGTCGSQVLVPAAPAGLARAEDSLSAQLVWGDNVAGGP